MKQPTKWQVASRARNWALFQFDGAVGNLQHVRWQLLNTHKGRQPVGMVDVYYNLNAAIASLQQAQQALRGVNVAEYYFLLNIKKTMKRIAAEEKANESNET